MHKAPRITYAQPFPTALIIMSITDTTAAPREQRARLFCVEVSMMGHQECICELTQAVIEEPWFGRRSTMRVWVAVRIVIMVKPTGNRRIRSNVQDIGEGGTY